MIQLHCFGESGHSYKAALGLTLAGIEWEPVKVDFFRGVSRTDDWRATVNPMGESPVLVDGQTRLTQSGVILDWLGERTGRYWGTTPAERREVLRWVLWDNHKMSSQAGALRFVMNFLDADKRSPDVEAFLAGRVRAALAVLNAHLQGRDWIVGDAISAADLSACGYLYYPEPFHFDRADWPEIDRWLDRIAALPGWAHPYDLMPRAWPADAAA